MLEKELEDKWKYKLLERNIINNPDVFIESYLLKDKMVIDKFSLYTNDMKITLDPELMITVKCDGKESIVFEYDPNGIDLLVDIIRKNGINTESILEGIDS